MFPCASLPCHLEAQVTGFGGLISFTFHGREIHDPTGREALPVVLCSPRVDDASASLAHVHVRVNWWTAATQLCSLSLSSVHTPLDSSDTTLFLVGSRRSGTRCNPCLASLTHHFQIAAGNLSTRENSPRRWRGIAVSTKIPSLRLISRVNDPVVAKAALYVYQPLRQSILKLPYGEP